MHPLAVDRCAPVSGGSSPGRGFRTLQAGLLAYGPALDLQQRLLARRHDSGEDLLILLRHPPVVTLGRGAEEKDLLLSRAELNRRGIEVHQVGRGGEVTWHGPGQVVGYPIVDLNPLGRDLHRYLRLLEEVLIVTLAGFGLEATRRAGKTGVWVGEKKIASIGVAVRRWIAWHGFALNVLADQSGFELIVPCGLPGVSMTSMEELLGSAPAHHAVEQEIIGHFGTVFSSRWLGACA